MAIGFSTQQKIFIARMAHNAIRLGRRVIGHTDKGVFARRGINWDLNLNEGIDFAIYLLGAFEPELIAFYKDFMKPGSIVLDLGANIGAHTLPMARCVGAGGRIVAVEATDYAHRKLLANIALNPVQASQITPIHALLVADPTTASRPAGLHSSWPLDKGEDVHPTLGGALKLLGAANVTTVDLLVQELGLPRVDWIKIDVDGHELEVLRGASETLKEHAPTMMIELAPYCHAHVPGQFESLVSVLLEAGYKLHDIARRRELPGNIDDVINYIPHDGSINVLATTKAIW
jgi:FkbM family methyltransferase